LFKDSDSVCFYVLSAFRKAINANVVALSAVCSFIIALVVVINIAFSSLLDFHWYFNFVVSTYLPPSVDFLRVPDDAREYVNKFAFATLSVCAGYATMGFYYYLIYDAFQRNNGQRMDLFLNQYLANLNSHFKEIHRNASQAVVEEKGDVHEVQQDAILWITNLQWMAFRVFFIESFLRGLLFQMRRNAGFALILVPLGILIPLIGILTLFEVFGIFPTLFFDLSQHLWFYLLVFVLMFLRYFRYRRDALLAIAGSVKAGWFTFRELDIQGAMSKIMESYINQLDQWRSRFRERGGPAG
jgi:hypothetical protein